MTIFETTDRDGDRFTMTQEDYCDGVAVTVAVRLAGETSESYAYLTAADVDRLRLALASYGAVPDATPTALPDPEPVMFAAPSAAVVERAQAAAIAAQILGEYPDAPAVVNLAAFIAGYDTPAGPTFIGGSETPAGPTYADAIQALRDSGSGAFRSAASHLAQRIAE